MRQIIKVEIKENESFDKAMKRFKKRCERSGLFGDLRRKQHYEKPSIMKRKQKARAIKRVMKAIRAAEKKHKAMGRSRR